MIQVRIREEGTDISGLLGEFEADQLDELVGAIDGYHSVTNTHFVIDGDRAYFEIVFEL